MSKPAINPTASYAALSGNQSAGLLDASYLQLYNSINDLATYSNYFVDSGAANAYVVTGLPAGLNFVYADGVILQIKAANPNSGASTLNAFGSGVKAIVSPSGAALTGGEIVAGQIFVVQAVGGGWQVTTSAPATITQHTFVKRSYITSGAGNLTTQAGTTLARIMAWAGGGGGGGGAATGVGQRSIGGGGGAGQYAEVTLTVTGNTAYAYSVGAAGAGGVGAAAGTAGGNTTFTVGATTLTSHGGGAGGSAAAGSLGAGGVGGTGATNGDFSIAGGNGGDGQPASAASLIYTAAGANAPLGVGNGGPASFSTISGKTGLAASGFASGGGGGGNPDSAGGASTGGAGTGGLIIVDEYH